MVSKSVAQFVVSPEQMKLDLKMVGSDIWGTQAHVLMLEKQKIVSKKNAARILQALVELERLHEGGEFSIDPGRGAQLTLEKEIIERAGEEAGLSTHTARSRNDQVMVTELIYLREEVLSLSKNMEKVARELVNLAKEHVATVMPGYTHMQPGKPTTFAHWCLLYAGSFERVLESLHDLLERYDQSPLGAVESFGTSWPIDREYTAELLGFSRVWTLPLDAISHRGFFQYELLQKISLGGITLSRIASDLLLYCTFEYGMIELGDDVAERLHPITGSSVMAQKRNPDALELMRAAGNQLNGASVSAFELLSGLPAGYNRDSRELKEYVQLGFRKFSSGLEVLLKTLGTLSVNKGRMEELVRKNYSLTTDLADFVAQSTGLPYRLVYKIVGKGVDKLMSEGRVLEEISAETLQEIAAEFEVKLEISNDELKKVLSPADALSRRAHIGGTAKKATEKVIALKLEEFGKIKERRKKFQARIDSARDKTSKEISSLLSAVEGSTS